MRWDGLKRYCKEKFDSADISDGNMIIGQYNKEGIVLVLLNDNFVRIEILMERNHISDRNIYKALECSNAYLVGGILKCSALEDVVYSITHCLSMDVSYEEFDDMLSVLIGAAKGIRRDLKG